jgi:predicted nucleic acid-binding protein
MRLALTDLFRAKWSATIHEEWMRNVLKNRPDLKREQLERTRHLMDVHVRDGLVIGYEPWIDKIDLPDPNDRHVLAAAIQAEANIILTFNLKDFPEHFLQPYNIVAKHPDNFITSLINIAPRDVQTVVKRHRASLKNPPKSVNEYLAIIEKQGLPETVKQLQQFAHLI